MIICPSYRRPMAELPSGPEKAITTFSNRAYHDVTKRGSRGSMADGVYTYVEISTIKDP